MPQHDAPVAGQPLKAGIAIDDWKLPVFERRLTEAGYAFENKGKLTNSSILLRVETVDMLALKKVIEACQNECVRLQRR